MLKKIKNNFTEFSLTLISIPFIVIHSIFFSKKTIPYSKIQHRILISCAITSSGRSLEFFKNINSLIYKIQIIFNPQKKFKIKNNLLLKNYPILKKDKFFCGKVKDTNHLKKILDTYNFNVGDTKTSKLRTNYFLRDQPKSKEIFNQLLIFSEKQGLSEIAYKYFSATPFLSGFRIWDTFSFDEKKDSSFEREELEKAAQLFHYDLDWPITLKIFIICQDLIKQDNGPFEFFSKSINDYSSFHFSRGRKSKNLVKNYGEPFRFTGNFGDFLMLDTRAIHRDMPVSLGAKGKRILQIEYTPQAFGAWEASLPDRLTKSLVKVN